MNRTERLFSIVEELRVAGPAGRTSAWLAERFEVSVRTIKRDMAALLAAEIPIWSTDGRGGGYRLARAAALPPLTFTSGEATAVAIALASEVDLPFGTDGRSALAKVLGSMSEQQRRATADLAGRIWFRSPARMSDPRWAQVLDEALRTAVVVNLDYRDRDGEISRGRPVEPLGFARTDGSWWLMAWCRRRDAPRWFRLDRIEAAHATRERFAPRRPDALFGTPPSDAQPVTLDL
jgi:predicted DNA-binding transcriptional regulator YafY